MTTEHTLTGEHLRLAYDGLEVASDLSIEIPPGRITVIVGPNACGKSTLLRALVRLLKPKEGVVLLDGESIHALPTRDVATRVGILPQSPIAPEGITVADLVSRGRYPHERWAGRRTAEDRRAIAEAMIATQTVALADRPVDELSGGQRQRAWIAFALAQDTPIMLLDEPTTFLDVAHQVEVLDILTDLNRDLGRTIVIVLHDLNLAARYAHHMIAMRDGAIIAQGPPPEVVTEELVQRVFGIACRVIPDPTSGTPLASPIGRHADSPPAPPGTVDPPLVASNGTSPARPDVIRSEDDLRSRVGRAGRLVLEKTLDHVDHFARSWIDHSPLVILATSDADGRADATPRGGAPGFVRVLGPSRVLLPERKGNRRVDTMVNILANPHVGMLFLVPGRDETLRVNGRAAITSDPALLEPSAVKGQVPKVGIVVDVEEVFFHCAASLRRSGAWEPPRWPDVSGLASLGTMLKDQAPRAMQGTTAHELDQEQDAWNREAPGRG